MRRLTLGAACLWTVMVCWPPAQADAQADRGLRSQHGSVLAFPLVTGETTPDLVLAQRTIERHWGPSDDSTYHEYNAPGWKSEGGAMAMSFALPGTGQLYAGERSGYAFLLLEALGIYQVWELTRSGNSWAQKSRDYAGDPGDSTSQWAFDTWEQRTGRSADDLRALYHADPSLFYAAIEDAADLQYGWTDYDSGSASQQEYSRLRGESELRRKHSRYWRAALWTNHLVSAVDALRAARLVNLPIQRNLELHLKSGWGHGGPQVAAVLERTF